MSGLNNSSNQGSPLISVIVPVFNRDKELLGVIQSLNSQTYKCFEVIFVDDYSTKPLASTLSNFDIQPKFNYCVLRNKVNRGVSFSRNVGVKSAKGDFICFLDSDDEWHRDKLLTNIKHVESSQVKTFVMSKTKVVDELGINVQPKGDFSQYQHAEEYLFEHGNFAQVSAFFLSRSLAKEIEFTESLSQYEDFLYFISAVNNAERKIFINKPLAIWNDKAAPGRLSTNKQYSQALDFIKETSGILDKRFAECFYIRFVMPYYFYQNVAKSIQVVWFCFFHSGIPKRTLAWLTFRGLLGPRITEHMKKKLKR